jgi:hypothetical protein
MATLFDLMGPATLEYDAGRGFQFVDSGGGAPLERPGWMRGALTPATSCELWTSDSPLVTGYRGLYAFGAGGWALIRQETECSLPSGVWCVED